MLLKSRICSWLSWCSCVNRERLSSFSAYSVFIFLEHGCYVKSDPRGHWLSRLERAVHQNLGTGCSFVPLHGKYCRCSQNFQYHTDWLVASNLSHSYGFDWNSQILAGLCVFLVRTEELLKRTTFYQCPLAEQVAKGLHAKNISHSLFSHIGFVLWIYQTLCIKQFIFL